MSANPEIFTSIGHLGTEPRQDERLVHNALVYGDTVGRVEGVFTGLLKEAREYEKPKTRIIYRGIVDNGVYKELKDRRYGPNIEVAVQLVGYEAEESSEPNSSLSSWLIYLAHNTPERATVPEDGDPYWMSTPKRITRPADRIYSFLESGDNSLQTVPLPEDEDQLADLWLPFGWSNDPSSEAGDQIATFRKSVAAQQHIMPNNRTLWYAASHQEDVLVSAAMAERIDMPGRYGKVNLVELTEWATRRDKNAEGKDIYTGQGNMAAALAILCAQVIEDLGKPFVYAELNTANQARFPARSVGINLADRSLAPQLLRQHVSIDDGKKAPGLRNFNFGSLNTGIVQDFYSREIIDDILQTTDRVA